MLTHSVERRTGLQVCYESGLQRAECSISIVAPAASTLFASASPRGSLKVAVGKGEVHRSTGCRDFRLTKIVAAELAAHWHRAIEAVKGMDAAKVRAGSIELLGGGSIPLGEAAAALGAAPQELARRLAARGASFFVNARNWLGGR